MTDIQLLPVIWTLVSMVVAVLVTLVFSPARAAYFRLTPAGRFGEQSTRFLYYVGVPYFALLTQAISPVDMGLAGTTGTILGWSQIDWLHHLNAGLIVGGLTLIPIGVAARQMARAGQPLGVDARAMGSIVVDAVCSEAHWAFYRAAPLIILDDAYWATLIGLALIGVEILVTIVRNGFGLSPEERQSWIRQALLLAMSAALFILTRNVWLITALHIAVEVLLKLWATRLAGQTLTRLTTPREVSEPVTAIEQTESPIV